VETGQRHCPAASNYYFGAAVARNGTLGVWGKNTYEGCGNGEVDDDYCVPEGFDEDVAFVHGWEYSLCITKKNGDATCIGYDYDDGDDGDFEDLPGYTRFGFDENVGPYDGYITGVKLLKVGSDAGCVVYKDGRLRIWGYDYTAQAGYADYPLPISFYRDAVDCGTTGYEQGACVVKNTGDVACSVTSVADEDGYYTTLPIPEDWDRGVAAIDCAYYGCCAWKANGDFTCWGNTYNDGSSYDGYDMGTIPNWVAGINKYTWRTFQDDKRRSLQSGGTSIRWPVMTGVVSYSLGYYTTCVLREDGSAQCWGYYTQDTTEDFYTNLTIQMTIAGYDYLF